MAAILDFSHKKKSAHFSKGCPLEIEQGDHIDRKYAGQPKIAERVDVGPLAPGLIVLS